MPLLFWLKAAGVGVAAFGLLWLVDEIGDRREAKVRAEFAAEERKKEKAVDEEVKSAADARLPAAAPGSVARLQKNWCRDCVEGKP